MRFISILLILLLILIEALTIPALPLPWRAASPLLVYLTYSAMQPKNQGVWILALVSGFFLDLFSIFPLGSYALTLTATTSLVSYLTYRFFTHRSMISRFILVAVASIFSGVILSLVRMLSFLITKNFILEVTLADVFQYILISTAANLVMLLIALLLRSVPYVSQSNRSWTKIS